MMMVMNGDDDPLQELMKASREEVKEALSSDPTLFHEVDYDLQQYEKQCAKQAAEAKRAAVRKNLTYRTHIGSTTDCDRQGAAIQSVLRQHRPCYYARVKPVACDHVTALIPSCDPSRQAEAAARKSMPPPPPRSPGDALKASNLNRRRSSVGTCHSHVTPS